MSVFFRVALIIVALVGYARPVAAQARGGVAERDDREELARPPTGLRPGGDPEDARDTRPQLTDEEIERALEARLERNGGLSTLEDGRPARAGESRVEKRSRVRGGEEGPGREDSDAEQVASPRERLLRPTSAFELQLQGYSDPGRPVLQFGYEILADDAAEGVDIPAGPDYVLGTADSLIISLWGGAVDEDYRAIIDREGQVRLPKVGLVDLKGSTLAQAEATLKEAFSSEFNNFDLRIRVAKVRDIAVHVLGRVARPGRLRVAATATVLEALAAAEGVTKDGSLRNIRLRRAGAEDRTIDLYDYLLDGDVTVDAGLAAGDAIVVPAVGPRVALVGRVLRPAIYEIAEERIEFADVLEMAGGYGRLADRQSIQVETIVGAGLQVRQVDLARAAPQATDLGDGDVVWVRESNPVLEDVVYVVGNVAQPGRFALAEGLRIADILTTEALVSAGFWLDLQDPAHGTTESEALLERIEVRKENRARKAADTDFVVTSRRAGATDGGVDALDPIGEYPEPFLEYALLRRIDPVTRQESRIAFHLGRALLEKDAAENHVLQSQDTIVIFPRSAFALDQTVYVTGAVNEPGEKKFYSGMHVRDLVRMAGGALPETWLDEAVLTRIHPDPNGARFEHLKIHLEAALAGDPEHDLELQKDDSLSIQTVPDYRRAFRVVIEGEVRQPGTYTVIPGEHLSDLIERAGGFTPTAYLPAAKFFRQSVQGLQQERLDQSLERLERETKLAAQRFAADASALDDKTSVEQEERRVTNLVQTLRRTRAKGRMVLHLRSLEKLRGSADDVVLETGDRLNVPGRPNEVHVLGAVFNQTALIYQDGLRVRDYLQECGGPTDTADMDIAYIIRADGTADSARHARKGFYWDGERGRYASSSLLSSHLYPGDTLVVPYDVKPRLSALGLTKAVTEILFNVAFATGVVIAAL